MQSESLQSVTTQLNILTAVMGCATILVGALLAYMKISTKNEITSAKLEINEKIDEAKRELKQDLARKDVVDEKLVRLQEQISEIRAWKKGLKPE